QHCRPSGSHSWRPARRRRDARRRSLTRQRRSLTVWPMRLRRWCALGRIARLLILGCVLAAAGCTERHPSDGSVTLVFKHAKILGPSDPVPGLLREFEAKNPGVRVRSESLTWSSDEQHQFYAVNLEGGNAGLDVLMLDCVWVPEFARAGWLLDLTPFV